MKISTRLLLLFIFNSIFSVSYSQLVTSWETFSSPYNTGYTRPVNTTFQGSIGMWGAYSSDNKATLMVSSQNKALHLINYKTNSTSSTSTAKATSPVVDCNHGCIGSAKLTFLLHTYQINQANSHYTFYVEASGDNGANWTVVASGTAQSIFSTYGSNTYSNITVQIPTNFLTSTFRYRLRGVQTAGSNYDNILIIDDIKLTTYPCNTNNLKLGNLVWDDVNLNNVRDANEAGIANATVKLYKDDNNDNVADGNALQTTTTNASGNYMFSNLAAGNYIAGVIIPVGNVRGAQSDVDPDNNVDNDNNGSMLLGDNQPGSEVRTKAVTLSAGTEPVNDGDDNNGNLTVDIALCQSTNTDNKVLCLGNLVFRDNNGNGFRDAGEPGIANATVKLYKDDNNDNSADGAAVRTTTTDANGMYLFAGLGAGNYIVGVTIPAGLVRGTSTANDPDNNIDNDNNGNNLIGTNGAGGEVRSLAITLAAGTEPTNDGDNSNGNLTLDIGLCPAPTNTNNLCLGNLIFRDSNGNGVRDAGEAGIANITVSLYKDTNNDNVADSSPYRMTTTDANGMYMFSNLYPGNYLIGVTIPAGLVRGTSAANDPDNNIDNDNNGNNLIGVNGPGGKVRTWSITLTAGGEPDGNCNYTLDIGLCPAPTNVLCLGNLIWRDTNGNGVRDAGEPGIANITVSLYKDDNQDNVADSTPFRTTTTNADGMYMFSNLYPGDYLIGVTIPAGLVRGTSSTNDPDNNIDNDNNGTRLVGVNGAGGKVRTYAITLTAGNEPDGNCNYTLDIGLCPAPNNSVTLGNLVWNDLNLNNFRDANEPGIAGVTVKLYKDDNNDNVADGTQLQSTTTDANGMYMFPNLSAGNYIVGVIIPTGKVRGAQSDVDPDNNIDNDNNGVTLIGNNAPGSEVRSKAITLAPGTEPTNDGDGNNGNLTLDIALCESSHTCTNCLTLGNQVWNDYDGDGRRNADEPAIEGAPVSLYRDDNGDNLPDTQEPIAITTSDLFGKYYFRNLSPGRYVVSVPILPGYQQSPNRNTGEISSNPDNDVDNDNNLVRRVGPNGAGGVMYSNAITLAEGQEPTTDGDDANGNLTMDCALCGNSYIGGRIWNDLNANGIREAGEPGLNGVTVKLTFPDGTEAFTTTVNFGGDGYYDFKSLGPWTYKFTYPSAIDSLNPTRNNQGSDDTKDSDPVNGDAYVTIAADQSDFTSDAGYTSQPIARSIAGNIKTQQAIPVQRVPVTADDKIVTSIAVYPNPTVNYFTLKVNAAEAGEATVRLTDVSGKIVSVKTIRLQPGTNILPFNDLAKAQAGTYNLEMITKEKVYSQKVVLLNR